MVVLSRLFGLFAALAVALALPLAASAQENPAHAEIRAMRDGAIAAFTAHDKAAFLGYLTDDVLFTAMNNETVHGKAEASAYYDRMLEGSNSVVSGLSLEFSVDDLTTLLAEGRAGVAAGGLVAHFTLRGGLDFTVPLRWTATIVQDPEGWKIAALHFSANMFDNPLDSPLRRYLWLLLGATALVALLIGAVLGRRSAR